MDSLEIRKKFIDFYKNKGHSVIPSVSLIPENDSTLLFVNSGMFPLVSYLLGEKHPAGKRLVNYQRSFRSDDIEEIGDNRHTTLFEMLGNWSFGDYFKKEQLNWWFEFLIEIIKIDPNKIYQTVYAGDNNIGKDFESIITLKEIYKKYGIIAEEGPETISKGEDGPGFEIDFKKYKIFAYKDKNWWQRGDALGELGGPDSETFYDTEKKHDIKFGKFCHLNCDCGRFLEIGNSVFMQYQKSNDGWKEIKNKNVDFGGGLERLAMAVNNLNNIFESDLFQSMIIETEKLSGLKYKENFKSFEIIADHVKAATFIIGDEKGIGPSNKEQGYFVRRLLRRVIRHGKILGIESNAWIKSLSEKVIEIYKDFYPELKKNSNFIFGEIKKEQDIFEKTLERGLKEFRKINSEEIINGKLAAKLYQSYGFPIELIQELASENNQKVDVQGFNKEMEKHQDLSRKLSSGVFKSGLSDTKEETTKLHTATHLLLTCLRKVLGDTVFQKGSNINSGRLRFDFSWDRKLSEDEIKKVQDLMNKAVNQNLKVIKEEMDIKQALSSGVIASFQEKYPEKVLVYSLIDKDGVVFSKEICSGPHVKETMEIGNIEIIKEEASSSGVRRIKAVIKR